MSALVAKGLGQTDLSTGGNVATEAGAKFQLPVQRYVLTSDVTGTLTIPNENNHAHIILDTGNFNINGNGSSAIIFNNSQGTNLILQGSGLITAGGTVTETATKSANGNTANFAGVTGVTVGRTSREERGSVSITTRHSGAGAIGYSENNNVAQLTISATTSFARIHLTTGSDFARGPAYQAGDSGLGLTAAQIAGARQLNAGQAISVATPPGSGASLIFGTTGRATVGASTTQYQYTATNNSGQSVTVAGVTVPSDGQPVNLGSETTTASRSIAVVRPATTTIGPTNKTDDGATNNFDSITGLTITRSDGAETVGALGSNNPRAGAPNNGAHNVSYTVLPTDAFVSVTAGRGNDNGRPRAQGTAGGVAYDTNPRNDQQSASGVVFRGPAWRSQDGQSHLRQLTADQTVTITQSSGTEVPNGGTTINSRRRTITQNYNFTATNNTGNSLTVNGNSVTNGATVSLSTNQAATSLAITVVRPAVNSAGQPLAPGAVAFGGTGVTNSANGSVTGGIDLTNFTGTYSRTS